MAHGTPGGWSSWVGGDWAVPGGGAGNNHLTSRQVKKIEKSTGPFRFVFIDGCSSAVGNAWPSAFGIYTGSVNNAGDYPNGLRPKTFLGWTEDVSMNPEGMDFVAEVFKQWTQPPDTSGVWELSSVGVTNAILNTMLNIRQDYDDYDLSAAKNYENHLKITGFTGLTYSSYNWDDEWPP